jgi:capsid protein
MLVDRWGSPIIRKFAKSADRSTRDRPWQPVELRDIGKLVPAYDRYTLASASRAMYLNNGPIRGAIDQKAMYSVGRSWAPEFQGNDKEFGAEAQSWLYDQWYGIGDVRGGMHDFITALFLMSVAIDRDGEAFVLLTQTTDGYPRYQHIPSHRIGNGLQNPSDKSIVDGIQYNSSGVPVAYSFVDEEQKFDRMIPARDIIHLYDPSWQEQGRGLPALTHALNDLRDMMQSHDWERLAQLMLSSIGIIETNETGMPDLDDPSVSIAYDGDGQVASSQPTVEMIDGGTVRYIKAGSGKIETIKNDRPGDAYTSFHDRILRSALAGIVWPYSLVWKGNETGGGTAQRTEIALAQRSIEDRQDVLFYAAKRMVSYAVAKAQKIGVLRPSPDWWRWKFTYPRKLTIDDGRVTKELLELWRAGKINDSEIFGMFGHGSPKEFYYQRAEEVAMKEIARAETEVKYGIKIDKRDMGMMTPNDMPDAEPEQETPTKPTE